MDPRKIKTNSPKFITFHQKSAFGAAQVHIPFRVRPLIRFPPLSWLPGHRSAQLAGGRASGNTLMSKPISPRIVHAAMRSMPGNGAQSCYQLGPRGRALLDRSVDLLHVPFQPLRLHQHRGQQLALVIQSHTRHLDVARFAHISNAVLDAVQVLQPVDAQPGQLLLPQKTRPRPYSPSGSNAQLKTGLRFAGRHSHSGALFHPRHCGTRRGRKLVPRQFKNKISLFSTICIFIFPVPPMSSDSVESDRRRRRRQGETAMTEDPIIIIIRPDDVR